jgi:hypothetical protein
VPCQSGVTVPGGQPRAELDSDHRADFHPAPLRPSRIDLAGGSELPASPSDLGLILSSVDKFKRTSFTDMLRQAQWPDSEFH